jgi:hypothetical protein
MPKKYTVWTDDDTETEIEITVPTVRAVCFRCNGNGVHDHPAFANGISPEQFAEDPDFETDYFRGAYDVFCSECDGAKVVDEIDWQRFEREQPTSARYLRERFDAEAEMQAEEAAERRAGC